MKIKLRPFQESDLVSLITHLNNPNISRYTSRIPYPYLRKDAEEWLDFNQKNDDAELSIEKNFAIELNGDLIGGIGVANIKLKSGEIGYWLCEEQWHKGLMKMALHEFIPICFNEFSLKSIYAVVHEENIASIKLLLNAGFQKEELEEGIKSHLKFILYSSV